MIMIHDHLQILLGSLTGSCLLLAANRHFNAPPLLRLLINISSTLLASFIENPKDGGKPENFPDLACQASSPTELLQHEELLQQVGKLLNCSKRALPVSPQIINVSAARSWFWIIAVDVR